MKISERSKSIQGILICQIPFMAGHYLLKFLLAIALMNYGHTEKEAYAIATGFQAASAICFFLWGTLANKLPETKNVLQISILFSGIAMFILALCPQFHMMALAVYTVSSSLYLFNTIIFINNHYESESERQRGNHLYTISLNSGTIVGVIFGSILISNNQTLLFLFGALAMGFGLIALCMNHQKMLAFKGKRENWQNTLFLIAFLGMVLGTYFFISFPGALRNLATTLFFLGTGYIIYLYSQEKNKNYLMFIAMNWLCSFMYWMDSTIFYTQLSVFLKESVDNTFFGLSIPALAIPSINPIIGFFFGWWFSNLYQRKQFTPHKMLCYGLTTLSCAFFALAIPIYFSSGQKIAFVYPLISIFIYSLGEFVVSSTLTSQSVGLINDSKKRGFFLAMNNISRATASAGSYYLIAMTIPSATLSKEAILQSDLTLYNVAGFATLIATILFAFIHYMRKVRDS